MPAAAETDIKGILDRLSVSDDVKAQAWDDFYDSADTADFQKRFDRLSIPDNAKADLWDAKFEKQSTSPVKATAAPGVVRAPENYQIGATEVPSQSQLDAKRGIVRVLSPQESAAVNRRVEKPELQLPARPPGIVGAFQHTGDVMSEPFVKAADELANLLPGPLFAPHRSALKQMAEMTRPENIGLIEGLPLALKAVAKIPGAARTLGTLFSTYFATEAGKKIVQSSPVLAKQVSAGDWTGAADSASDIMIAGTIGALAAKHGVQSASQAVELSIAEHNRKAAELFSQEAAKPSYSTESGESVLGQPIKVTIDNAQYDIVPAGQTSEGRASYNVVDAQGKPVFGGFGPEVQSYLAQRGAVPVGEVPAESPAPVVREAKPILGRQQLPREPRSPEPTPQESDLLKELIAPAPAPPELVKDAEFQTPTGKFTVVAVTNGNVRYKTTDDSGRVMADEDGDPVIRSMPEKQFLQIQGVEAPESSSSGTLAEDGGFQFQPSTTPTGYPTIPLDQSGPIPAGAQVTTTPQGRKVVLQEDGQPLMYLPETEEPQQVPAKEAPTGVTTKKGVPGSEQPAAADGPVKAQETPAAAAETPEGEPLPFKKWQAIQWTREGEPTRYGKIIGKVSNSYQVDLLDGLGQVTIPAVSAPAWSVKELGKAEQNRVKVERDRREREELSKKSWEAERERIDAADADKADPELVERATRRLEEYAPNNEHMTPSHFEMYVMTDLGGYDAKESGERERVYAKLAKDGIITFTDSGSRGFKINADKIKKQTPEEAYQRALDYLKDPLHPELDMHALQWKADISTENRPAVMARLQDEGFVSDTEKGKFGDFKLLKVPEGGSFVSHDTTPVKESTFEAYVTVNRTEDGKFIAKYGNSVHPKGDESGNGIYNAKTQNFDTPEEARAAALTRIEQFADENVDDSRYPKRAGPAKKIKEWVAEQRAGGPGAPTPEPVKKSPAQKKTAPVSGESPAPPKPKEVIQPKSEAAPERAGEPGTTQKAPSNEGAKGEVKPATPSGEKPSAKPTDKIRAESKTDLAALETRVSKSETKLQDARDKHKGLKELHQALAMNNDLTEEQKALRYGPDYANLTDARAEEQLESDVSDAFTAYQETKKAHEKLLREAAEVNPLLSEQPDKSETSKEKESQEKPGKVITATTPEPSSASTQVNLPKEFADKVRAFGETIPDDVLAGDGRETDPHITVKYGLHDDSPSAASKLLKGHGPITARIGVVSIFPAKEGDESDVVKLVVESDDLKALNQKVADALPHTDTFPKYVPHVTIAYVKPGAGKKYVGRAVPGVTGKTITFDAVTFSPAEGKNTEISLAKPTTAAEAFRMNSAQLAELAAKGDAAAQAEIDRRDKKRADAKSAKPETKPAPAGTKAPKPETKAPAAETKPAAAETEHPELNKGDKVKFNAPGGMVAGGTFEGWEDHAAMGGVVAIVKTAGKRRRIPVASLITAPTDKAQGLNDQLTGAVQTDHLTDEQVDQVADILDKSEKKPASTKQPWEMTVADLDYKRLPPEKRGDIGKATNLNAAANSDLVNKQLDSKVKKGDTFTWRDDNGERGATIVRVDEYPDGRTFDVALGENKYHLPGTTGGSAVTKKGLTLADMARRGFDLSRFTPSTQAAKPPSGRIKPGDRVEVNLHSGKSGHFGTVMSTSPDGTFFKVEMDEDGIVREAHKKDVSRTTVAAPEPAGDVYRDLDATVADRLRQVMRNPERPIQADRIALLDALVNYKGNNSEKHGIKLGLWPLWASKEADKLIERARAQSQVPQEPERDTSKDPIGTEYQSFKAEIEVSAEPGKWYPNGQAFATREEADSAGNRTFSNWMAAKGYRVVPSTEKPNYRWVDGRSVAITEDNEIPELEFSSPEPTEKKGAVGLAEAIYQKLRAGESLGNVTELNKLSEKYFGASRTSGQWTPKDAFDAMEAGINKLLIERGADLLSMPFDQAMTQLRDLMSRVTTQGVRTDEQIAAQQFSTPPTEAFVVAKVANLTPEDVVLEPSAGNGGIAAYPKSIGATVHVNEISDRRREMLEAAGFGTASAVDGEIINSLLDRGIRPTVVLMNPPFSAGALKKNAARNNNQYGFNHVNAALQRLEPNGRLVAILGGGRANDPNGGANLLNGPSGEWFRDLGKRYNVRANIRVHGSEYAKYGTSFATRIIVIDKNGPTPSRLTSSPNWDSTVRGNVETLDEAYNLLRDVEQSRPSSSGAPGAGSARADQPATVQTQPGDRAGARRGGLQRGDESGDTGERVGGGQSGLPGPTGSRAGSPTGQTGQSPRGRQPGDVVPGSRQSPAARGGESSPQDVDVERPVRGADPSDLAANAGVSAADIIAAATQQLAEQTGNKPASATPPARVQRAPRKPAQPRQKPVAPAPAGQTQLSAQAQAAEDDLRKLLNLPKDEEPIRFSREFRQERSILDANVLTKLAVIGADQILKGDATYPVWNAALRGRIGDLVDTIAERTGQTSDDVLRQIYGLSSAVAKNFGVEAAVAPAPDPSEADNKPLDGHENDQLLDLNQNQTQQSEEEDSSAYAIYRPSIAGPAHPGVIVETKAMSTVPLPAITYRPNLPASVIKDGTISAVQLEAIALAGQANEIILPNGSRAGILIGDGCVAAGTRIFDPVHNVHVAIEVLASRGQNHFVLSLTEDGFKPCWAYAPFMKGYANLYHVALMDGRRITVTDEHRFLTPQGWKTLKDGIQIGDLLAVQESTVPLSHPAGDPDALPGSARSCSDRPEDCLDRCFASDPSRGGAPLPREAGSAQVLSPSPTGAREHSPSCQHGDGQETSLEHSHRHPHSDRLSRSSSLPSASRDRVSNEAPGYACGVQGLSLKSQTPSQSSGASISDQGVPVAVARQAAFSDSGFSVAGRQENAEAPRSSFLSSRIEQRVDSRSAQNDTDRLSSGVRQDQFASHNHSKWARIRSITFVRRDAYYDMYVPGPENYLAEGFVNHNTGVGKGSEAAGILWDNWRQGRKRLVWVSVKWDLMQDALRDLNRVGAAELTTGNERSPNGQYRTPSTARVQPFGRWKAGEKIDHEGVLFSTYALIRSESKKGERRVDQLEEYLRGDDDGEGAYIVWDESSALKNAVVARDGEASQVGVAVKDLLAKIPKLRTTSLSATAATEVMNLGYLDRLGLWGPGTAFPTGFTEFGTAIAGGRLAAMELVARELKSMGRYVSRTLSFKGVSYKEEEHALNKEQKDLYRVAARAWASVVQQAEAAIATTTNGGGHQRGRFLSQFAAAQQRFFGVLITALKTPTAIELTNKALAEGKSVVITLVNTNEAAQNREKNRVAAIGDDEDEIPDYDFGPKKMLTDLVQEHFPVQQYVDDVDEAGNAIKVAAYTQDEQGRNIPVNNPEAEAMRDALIAEINTNLHMPENPLNIMINALGGPSKVAEMTGRKERFDSSVGKFVPRGDQNATRKDVNLFEMRAFQEGKKRVAILSGAADTGISLHSDLGAKNQQPRYHVTLQAGWSADKAMQMLGRTHRTNQAHPPEYILLYTDLGGEKRFIATISRRLGSLGALTKGQKDASSGTDLMDKVTFETDQGRAAAASFYNSLMRNQVVPGTQLTGMQVLTDMRMLKGDPPTVPIADRTHITRMLNRILALDPDVQNPTFNFYFDIFQATVQQAIENGTLDTGVKTIPGDEFKVTEQRSIAQDAETGAHTFYYPVDVQVRTNRVSPKQLQQRMREHKNENPVVVRGQKGEIALVIDAKPIVHANGSVENAIYISKPGNGTWVKQPAYKMNSVKPVKEWAEESLTQAERDLRTEQSTFDYWQKEVTRRGGDVYYRDLAEKSKEKLAEIQKKVDDAQAIIKDPDAWIAEEWDREYSKAPSHETERYDLIGGSVLKFWNPITEASGMLTDIFTTVDSKTGQRVVGIYIPPEAIGQVLQRIGSGASTVDTRQLILDVLSNNLTYELEGGITVRRGAVGRVRVVQLMPPNSQTAEALKTMGVISEKGVVPVYYVPNNSSNDPMKDQFQIVDKILKQYPVKSNGGGPEDPVKFAREQKPLYEYSYEELEEAETEARGRDQSDLTELFGEDGAKRYQQLQRTANRSMRPFVETSSASDEIEKMEGSLTEEQRNRLFGIGDDRPTLEDIQDYRHALGQLDYDSPEALGRSLKYAITKVGKNFDPVKMDHKQRVALAQLRQGFEQARELGFDTKSVTDAALRGSAERFKDTEDAEEMLGHLRRMARGTPQSRQVVAPDWPTAQYRNGILWVNSSGMKIILRHLGEDPGSATSGAFIPANRTRPLADIVGKDMAPAIAYARSEGAITVARHDPGQPISKSKELARHELFHVAEIWGVARAGRELINHPLGRKTIVNLSALGYEGRPAILFSEVGAHLASGPIGWQKLGLTRSQAKELWGFYLDLVDPEVINNLTHIAPDLNEELYAKRGIERTTDADLQSSRAGTGLDAGERGADDSAEDRQGQRDLRRGVRPDLSSGPKLAREALSRPDYQKIVEARYSELSESKRRQVLALLTGESQEASQVAWDAYETILEELKVPDSESAAAIAPAGGGTSKIGISIERKSIEAKLTAGFDHLAEYTPLTIKDQAERAARVMRDPARARRIINGEEGLPDGLRGTALIVAAEDYIERTADVEMAYELANSPLVSATSAAAQELRLAAERKPDSVVARLKQLRDARRDAAKKKHGDLTKAKAEIKRSIRVYVKQASPRYKDFASFVDSLICK